MFKPEFRYLLIQEQRNGQMMPIVAPYLLSGLLVCGINGIALVIISYLLYKFSELLVIPVRKFWVLLVNYLMKDNNNIILYSGICYIIMLLSFAYLHNVLDGIVNKLKKEIKWKDEKIRELEFNIRLLEEEFINLEKKTKIVTFKTN